MYDCDPAWSLRASKELGPRGRTPHLLPLSRMEASLRVRSGLGCLARCATGRRRSARAVVLREEIELASRAGAPELLTGGKLPYDVGGRVGRLLYRRVVGRPV